MTDEQPGETSIRDIDLSAISLAVALSNREDSDTIDFLIDSYGADVGKVLFRGNVILMSIAEELIAFINLATDSNLTLSEYLGTIGGLTSLLDEKDYTNDTPDDEGPLPGEGS